MSSFGKQLTECRKQAGLSQKDLAKAMNTSHSVIGKYERDEMVPSIEAAKKLAVLLNTTVAYLVGEAEDNIFKEPEMLQRLIDLNKLSDKDKEHALFNLDAVLRDAKTRKAYAK
jgi:transcriptional regulator with XRE-family HTH domain